MRPVATLALALIAACQGGSPASPNRTSPAKVTPEPPHGLRWPTFHGDRARTGWNRDEPTLTPEAISRSPLTLAWESAPFDDVTLGGTTFPAHAYASPVYADDFPVGSPGGPTLSVVFVATTNGDVYAVAAFDAQTSESARLVKAGSVLWHTRLGTPLVVPLLDGGLPLGVLSTPFLDASATPPRLYVVANEATFGWSAYALDATTGAVLSGWPVVIDDASTSAVNRNGPATFQGAAVLSQRGALNVSPDGATLYVPFGAYSDGGMGWMVAIDTTHPAVVAAHSSAPSSQPTAYGGIWSAGGAAIDADGTVYAATGNSPDVGGAPHVWGESLLQWRSTLELTGTYTPFNYCALDAMDADVGGSSPVLLPELDASATSTPRLLALGSKQGNVYLVDRAHLPGDLLARPPCSTDSTSDGSLLSPEPQPQFGARGPLNVFGPYSELYSNLNRGKMRTTPAVFQKGVVSYLYVSGTQKAAADSPQSVPPSVTRLRVVTAPGAPAYLAIDGAASTVTMVNPGSPVVTSARDGTGVVVWVIDENAPRTASLSDPNAPHPILFAIDGTTLRTLWSSGQTLNVGGKYLTPVVAHGTVVVATDRLQAFTLGKP